MIRFLYFVQCALVSEDFFRFSCRSFQREETRRRDTSIQVVSVLFKWESTAQQCVSCRASCCAPVSSRRSWYPSFCSFSTWKAYPARRPFSRLRAALRGRRRQSEKPSKPSSLLLTRRFPRRGAWLRRCRWSIRPRTPWRSRRRICCRR